MKEVTAAVIIENGKILIAQRKESQKLAGKWEFPGGKVEAGETLRECLIREIKEELGITIEVDDLFAEIKYRYDIEEIGTINLYVFKARRIGGEYKLTAHSQIKWVRPEELEDYDFVPADTSIIKKLKEDLI
ncbi:8-oxo-dGTP diphosphatase [Herbinix hemicellulosilytica]|uniref:8-oxo-dGTP diphosphatase n=1 Tax=Herbinix hemicellulosilytica TaxID=1564487 RepID=A0A0H5SF43_HERHM|nr:8-oxo-dGTP diphosphatase MutT [Herbinix hemicellulosilytica]RBP56459.1 8-oxo-dGTP diphosphatase [Herbinix hemicellulosilytica]CRZ34039.1 hypothetical protein HHT355_0836 [Herbinix hemicellulosilytica]